MLDVLVGRPLDEILDTINISNDIRVALTTGDNRYGEILWLVLVYEKASGVKSTPARTNWACRALKFLSWYETSVKWVEQIFDTEKSQSATSAVGKG